MIAITAAPTSPVSCVRAPADSATGVRDALLEIGNPLEQPGRRVRKTERDDLMVRVDVTTETRSERSGKHARVREGNERDADRCGGERRQVGRLDERKLERRQPSGQRADDGDLVGEPEDRDRGHGQGDRDEHARHARRQPPQNEDQDDRARSDQQRGKDHLPIAQSFRERHELPYRSLGVHRVPEHLRQLRDDHGQRDPVQVAVADRQ
jgi:hypothetical protein